MRIQKPLASRSELSDSCQLLLQASWNTVMAKVGLPLAPAGMINAGSFRGVKQGTEARWGMSSGPGYRVGAVRENSRGAHHKRAARPPRPSWSHHRSLQSLDFD